MVRNVELGDVVSAESPEIMIVSVLVFVLLRPVNMDPGWEASRFIVGTVASAVVHDIVDQLLGFTIRKHFADLVFQGFQLDLDGAQLRIDRVLFPALERFQLRIGRVFPPYFERF